MTDETQTLGGTSANKGVKRGLPTMGLPAAEEAAVKLWSIARLGMTSPEAFARQFGAKAKASGSTWDTRMALLRGFNLIVTEGKQVGLSELGQQIVNSSNLPEQLAARRAALMHLRAYRELIESFDGTVLPEIATLATRLQFEYGKTEEFAKRAAQAFVESLDHAEMKDSQGVVHATGEPSGANPKSAQATADEEEAEAVEIDAAFEEERIDEELRGEVPNGAGGLVNVSLAVSLDLSAFAADDVVKILRALGASVEPN